MREIDQLISYKNNERLCIDSLSDQNDQCNSNLSKNKLILVFIVSILINDVAILGWFAASEKE